MTTTSSSTMTIKHYPEILEVLKMPKAVSPKSLVAAFKQLRARPLGRGAAYRPRHGRVHVCLPCASVLTRFAQQRVKKAYSILDSLKYTQLGV